MPCTVRIPNVGPGGIIAVFVGENTLQDIKFFAKRVFVFGKGTVRCVSDDRCRTCFLIANPVQHLAVDAAGGRSDPFHFVRIYLNALRKIRMQLHKTLLFAE